MTALARIVQVGNSRGVRLPKAALQESGLDGEVEIVARPGEITLRAVRHPRAGWAEAFAEMAKRGDDAPVWPDPAGHAASEFDETEWSWPL